jgi:6-phospho-3-hexuloisomerase
MTASKSDFRAALDELGAALDGVDMDALEATCKALAAANRIGVYACGREGLAMRGLAMRMFHLGMPVGVVGDMTMPPLGPGDLFFACTGPGVTTTVIRLMEVAREAGATVILLTAQPQSEAARRADSVFVLPAQTMANDQGAARTSVLPMGSVFEGAMFVLFEIMILRLRDLRGETPDTMRARHTNME